MKLYTLLATGIIATSLVSCGGPTPPNNDSDDSSYEPPKEEQIDSTGQVVTWADMEKAELEKDQFIIIEGYVGQLPKQVTSYGEGSMANFRIQPRRNATRSTDAIVSLRSGTAVNQIHPLKDGYLLEDYKIVMKDKQFASVGDRIRIYGQYDKGFSDSRSIDLITIELVEEQFDEAIFETAVELTDEVVADKTQDEVYCYVDANLDLNNVNTGFGGDNVWLPLKNSSNSAVERFMINQGTLPGMIDKTESGKIVVYDYEGNEVTQGTRVRIYGMGKKLSATHVMFTPEEFVKK